jgi:DHA1 family tetracycline resistance protein-like MFS transporter
MGGLAGTGRGFWIATFVLIVGNVCGPTQSAIMSRLVGPSEQGLLAGATTSVRSFNGIVAPLVFTALFAFCVRAGGVPVSGVPNVCAGLLMAVAGVIAWFASRGSRSLE